MFGKKTQKALIALNEKISLIKKYLSNDIEEEINKKNNEISIIKNYLLEKNIESKNLFTKLKKQIENDENKITNLTTQMEKLVNENKEIKETIQKIINAVNALIKKENIGE